MLESNEITTVKPVQDTEASHDIKVIEYDYKVYPFRAWFEAMFKTHELESLHLMRGVTANNFEQRVFEARMECEGRIEELHPLFQQFFDEVVVPEFGPILSWQKVPTVRTHFAVVDIELEQERNDLKNYGPAAFLKKHYFDSYRPAMFHRDKDYGLQVGTVNLWLPVTNVDGANSLWLGGRNLRGRDALPIELKMGQCLFFDGASCWHGVVWNTSVTTRVSFDIRFLPKSAIKSI